ncbi:uncharacterized protein CXQ87_004489 [Candidozyma duobushaemuli]|uniref:Amino-acid acetyltransferase, mitochondrial n=1 Tax=Candidozyma duobushaemuli TaxID=1231522 RepID=A0A2V1AJ52_9ASCO|nr:uncharacterized protein CXQ87_004489 [[Candida] duobushaemulonis]PVH16931.1 hypothetical protein CXQ87_004489 [[Candida] duobushaemulonis]
MAGFPQSQDDSGSNFARSYSTVESGHSEDISELSRQGSYESQTPSYESSHSRNPLARLLSRSRSSTLGGDKERFKADDHRLVSEQHATSRGRFTSKKLKWKVGSEKHNDESSYLTENQKQFFMKSAEPSGKLASAPSIAQFFNRPLASHGDKDLLKKEQFSKKQSGRTNVTLSSQSSNSLIQDVKLASRFRFNSPESSVVAAPSSTHSNSSSLQGLHRKYSMSADQFILQKWNKSMGLEVNANVKSSKHPSYQKLSDEFEGLSEHLERMFKPQEKTPRTTMPLEYTVEELARVVYHRIVEPTFDQPKLVKSPNTLEENPTFNPVLDDSIDEAKEVRQHEVLHELLQSTKSWLATLKRSWLESLKLSKGTDIDAKLNLVDLWRALAEIWTYFNKFVRFTLMQILIPVMSRTQVPLWVAIIFKEQNKCNFVPPPWLNVETLREKYDEEVHNKNRFSELPWNWQELAKIYFRHAPDDLSDTVSALFGILQDIKEIRKSKAQRGLKELNESNVQLNGLSVLEINEIKPFVLNVMNELRLLHGAAGGEGDSHQYDEDVPTRNIPVLLPVAYDVVNARHSIISSQDALLALVEQLNRSQRVVIEKVVFVDTVGGIPSIERDRTSHVFINNLQEYSDIVSELHIGFLEPEVRDRHLSNLSHMRELLLATQSESKSEATGIILRPEDLTPQADMLNPVAYNILTDRPLISSSLPPGRLRTPQVTTSIIKSGFDVQLFYPTESGQKRFDSLVSNSGIDGSKLLSMIDDSFGRKLEREDYVKRLNSCLDCVIIIGNYDGGAIITKEETSDGHKVPYLDKFAITKKNQGLPSLADVIFKSMLQAYPEEDKYFEELAANERKTYNIFKKDLYGLGPVLMAKRTSRNPFKEAHNYKSENPDISLLLSLMKDVEAKALESSAHLKLNFPW